jgi:hypothetical protein
MFIIVGTTDVDCDIKIVMIGSDFSSLVHLKCEIWAISLQDETVKKLGWDILGCTGVFKRNMSNNNN